MEPSWIHIQLMIFLFCHTVVNIGCRRQSERKSLEPSAHLQFGNGIAWDNSLRWKIAEHFVVHRSIQGDTTG